jgi:hypothetical protein
MFNGYPAVFLTDWDGLAWMILDGNRYYVAQISGSGGSVGTRTLVRPRGITCDKGDNLYITDDGNTADVDADTVAEFFNPKIKRMFVINDTFTQKFYRGLNLIAASLNDSNMQDSHYDKMVLQSPLDMAYKITKQYDASVVRGTIDESNSIVTEVQMFDNVKQQVHSYIVGFGGDAFEIDGFNAYFVRLKNHAPMGGINVKLKGVQWRIPSLAIKKGINWVNLSQNFYRVTQAVFQGSANNVTEIQKYDAASQTYKVCYQKIGRDYNVGDFSEIELGVGYILIAKADCSLSFLNVNL